MNLIDDVSRMTDEQLKALDIYHLKMIDKKVEEEIASFESSVELYLNCPAASTDKIVKRIEAFRSGIKTIKALQDRIASVRRATSTSNPPAMVVQLSLLSA